MKYFLLFVKKTVFHERTFFNLHTINMVPLLCPVVGWLLYLLAILTIYTNKFPMECGQARKSSLRGTTTPRPNTFYE